MNTDAKTFIAAGAIAAFLAVAFGAFGAHALRDRLPPDQVAVYRTAVEYHFWHALGLIAVGLTAPLLPSSSLIKWAGWVMVAGIVLFSGSLYMLALSGFRAMGAITPIGGLCLLSAWVLFAAAVLRT
jgi:uncharacterized membrane protein YgdD (TMEM256/DUF423 family)